MIKNDNKIWSDLADKVAKKGGDGEAFVLALQDLYSIFTPDFATWIGGLYNHELGGFHAANSGRDTEGYYPDIESTFQAVNTIATVGIVKKATDLPPVMRERLISFISSLQSPDDGYMYHPWWDYKDPEWRLRDARLGRDMMWAISLEKELDFKLPYPTANDRLKAMEKGESTDCKLPDHLTSEEAFVAYLDKLDWVNDAYFAGNMMAAQAGQIKAAGLAPCAAEYLGKIFREEMKKIDSPMIELVRGKGLLNAVIIKPKDGKEAWDVCMKMKENGVLAKPTHRHIIRFAPPLVITEEELRKAIEIIKETILSF